MTDVPDVRSLVKYSVWFFKIWTKCARKISTTFKSQYTRLTDWGTRFVPRSWSAYKLYDNDHELCGSP